jgi:hypothetical protein
MKNLKIVFSVLVFVPALLICLVSNDSLAQGLFYKSFGCIASFVVFGLLTNYMMHFSKIKGNGFLLSWMFVIIGAICTFVASLF